MKNAHPSARAGFTLIELLMVVLIIGLLSALLLVAVNAGVIRAREAAVATEIEQMSVAVESFKNDKGAYPISAGWTFKETYTSPSYGPRIMRTVSKVFPRYAADYTKFREHVGSGTLHINGGLDVNNLDQAESLVFWLGGLPDPDSETKLIGFRNDPAQPFMYPIDTTKDINDVVNINSRNKNRQQPRFAFDPTRLVDYDNDGWWEYVPKMKPTLAATMAPFVYFDSPSYDFFPFYPVPTSIGGLGMTDSASALQWGQVIPYASESNINPPSDPKLTSLSASGSTYRPAWMNSKKFQIIAAGRDGCYGRTINPDIYSTDPIFPAAFNETRLLPGCYRAVPTTIADQLLPDTELDNQTNFTTGKLGDDRP